MKLHKEYKLKESSKKIEQSNLNHNINNNYISLNDSGDDEKNLERKYLSLVEKNIKNLDSFTNMIKQNGVEEFETKEAKFTTENYEYIRLQNLLKKRKEIDKQFKIISLDFDSD